MNERPLDTPEYLWQSQNEEEVDMNLEDIRRKAHEFQRKIAWRNRREDISLAVAACACIAGVVFLPTAMLKAGAALTLLGAIANAYQLHRDGAARDVPAEASAVECRDFHRRELVRQKALLDSIGPRYIGPVLPGLAVFLAGAWMLNPGWPMAVPNVLAVAVMAGVYWVNAREARRLGREIETLTAE